MNNIKLDLQGRKVRGYAIISKGDIPEQVKMGLYIVPSQANAKVKYRVTHHRGDLWSCDCLDHKERMIDCKHIHACRFWLKIKDRVDNDDFVEKETFKVDVCPECKSDKLIKRGVRKNKNVQKQRYSCKECGKRFILDVASKTKGNGKIVTLCLDLYFKGISLRKIQDHIYQFYNFRISHMTIQRWIRKFMVMANQHAKAMMPKTSGIWHADEQMIKNNGSYLWIWNVVDRKTRFLLANNVTETRFLNDAREIFSKAKACGTPDMIVTDGLKSYIRAIPKEFGWHKVTHIKADGLTSKKKNNNMIERFHGSFRERDKVMRGFKGQDNAEFLAESYRTYYNFVRPHEALGGLTPSQMAKIRMQRERNRWINLLNP